MKNSAIRVLNALQQSVDEAASCRTECVSTRLTAGCLTWWTVIPAVER